MKTIPIQLKENREVEKAFTSMDKYLWCWKVLCMLSKGTGKYQPSYNPKNIYKSDLHARNAVAIMPQSK